MVRFDAEEASVYKDMLILRGKEIRGYDGLMSMEREHDESVSIVLTDEEKQELIEELEESIEGEE